VSPLPSALRLALAVGLTALLVPRTAVVAQGGAAPDVARGGLETPAALRRDASALADRLGLWASVGGGRGTAGLACAACRSDAGPAVTLHATVGGRVHPRFLVGVEYWAWLDVLGGGLDRTARGIQAVARHYPSESRALFVAGGLGTSRFALDDGNARFHAAAPALSLGAGWDLPFRGVVLTPTLVMTASTGGALRADRTGNALADNARLGLWRGTVAVTWF
jgi:hypothetical protein